MARKNANGEGSRPRQRADGRWEARYWKNGKRRSVYGSTRKEAADTLAKALANKDEEPTGFEPTNITVAVFFTQYEHAAKLTMKRRSLSTLSSIHRSAWKGYSQKFARTVFSEIRQKDFKDHSFA